MQQLTGMWTTAARNGHASTSSIYALEQRARACSLAVVDRKLFCACQSAISSASPLDAAATARSLALSKCVRSTHRPQVAGVTDRQHTSRRVFHQRHGQHAPGSTHRRRDATVELSRFGVGGVHCVLNDVISMAESHQLQLQQQQHFRQLEYTFECTQKANQRPGYQKSSRSSMLACCSCSSCCFFSSSWCCCHQICDLLRLFSFHNRSSPNFAYAWATTLSTIAQWRIFNKLNPN